MPIKRTLPRKTYGNLWKTIELFAKMVVNVDIKLLTILVKRFILTLDLD